MKSSKMYFDSISLTSLRGSDVSITCFSTEHLEHDFASNLSSKQQLKPALEAHNFLLTTAYYRITNTMHREKLLITALPAWCKLNDVNFLDSRVEDLGGSKGFGLVTERALNSKGTFDIPTLLTVPRDLILCAEAVEEHGKADQHFRRLLDAAGGKVSP